MTTAKRAAPRLRAVASAVSVLAALAACNGGADDTGEAARSPSTVAKSATPSEKSPRPTAPAPEPEQDDGSESERKAGTPDAETARAITSAAMTIVRAYGDTKRPVGRWRAGLMRHVARDAAPMYERRPPGPALKPAKAGASSADEAGVAVAVVQTTAGDRLRVTLVWEDEAWKLDLIAPTTQAVPAAPTRTPAPDGGGTTTATTSVSGTDEEV